VTGWPSVSAGQRSWPLFSDLPMRQPRALASGSGLQFDRQGRLRRDAGRPRRRRQQHTDFSYSVYPYTSLYVFQCWRFSVLPRSSVSGKTATRHMRMFRRVRRCQWFGSRPIKSAAAPRQPAPMSFRPSISRSSLRSRRRTRDMPSLRA